MVYLDSSFVFSVHARDTNTVGAVGLLQSAPIPFVFSRLCEVEFVNALALRLFRKEILPAQAQASISRLERHIRSGVYKRLAFPEEAYERAKTLALTLTPSIGVRTADWLHVAAAIELGAVALYTFDQRQHRTAQAAGLKVNSLP